jgi:hypothetical protein
MVRGAHPPHPLLRCLLLSLTPYELSQYDCHVQQQSEEVFVHPMIPGSIVGVVVDEFECCEGKSKSRFDEVMKLSA